VGHQLEARPPGPGGHRHHLDVRRRGGATNRVDRVYDAAKPPGLRCFCAGGTPVYRTAIATAPHWAVTRRTCQRRSCCRAHSGPAGGRPGAQVPRARVPGMVRSFFTVYQRRAERAARLWRVIPRGAAMPRRRADGHRARRAGASARGTLTSPGWPLPPLHQQAHGGRAPVRYPGHRPLPVGRRHAADRARAGAATLPALPALS